MLECAGRTQGGDVAVIALGLSTDLENASRNLSVVEHLLANAVILGVVRECKAHQVLYLDGQCTGGEPRADSAAPKASAAREQARGEGKAREDPTSIKDLG